MNGRECTLTGFASDPSTRQLDLTDIPRLARNLGRLAEIARTLAKYGLADCARRGSTRIRPPVDRGHRSRPPLGESREARIRLALTELGTTFIKFGQVLSTPPRPRRPGPRATNSPSSSRTCPPTPSRSPSATVEEELGQPLDELFAEFEPVPLASASIGQVHRATLHDGRQVVVKVQHPDIVRRIADDLAILAELADAGGAVPAGVAALPPGRGGRRVRARRCCRELDFRRELRHLQLFRQAFADDPGVVFPEPYPTLSTGRVLTMEFLDGIPFNDPEEMQAAGGDLDDLARRGAKAFLDMIFRDGFFHADPHPGNVLFLPPTSERPRRRDRAARRGHGGPHRRPAARAHRPRRDGGAAEGRRDASRS